MFAAVFGFFSSSICLLLHPVSHRHHRCFTPASPSPCFSPVSATAVHVCGPAGVRDIPSCVSTQRLCSRREKKKKITKNTVSTRVSVNSSPQLLEMSGSHRSGRPTLISSYVQSYFCFLRKQHINAAPTPPPCSLQKARAPLLASWCLAMKHPLTVLRCCQTRRADVFHGCPELSRAEQHSHVPQQSAALSGVDVCGGISHLFIKRRNMSSMRAKTAATRL